MLLSTTLRKSWIYRVCPFISIQDASLIGSKVPDREFYWSAIMKFIPEEESEIVNESGIQTKKESSTEKRTVSLKDLF